ncbi:MAG: 1,3-beta-galactosyl-N-acetylhexosamine phosphorylase [Clostridiales bacterium]|nr:1,3-beta-galactosyl-N-acetylhexosamine phosphorylase [Clostridiales bacterium]
MDQKYRQGGFTLPGEAGYEKLTLELAKKWGADVIRDSDGTKLSPEIVEAGYSIYSTICIIRQHNAFAAEHPDSQQQSFLCSDPVVAQGDTLVIRPMDGYFDEQFELNDTPDALGYWQVYDRTTDTEVPRSQWTYADGRVTVTGCTPWHQYTVSFLCWRIWEEINMYNHTTNSWTTEHLRQLDPRHPAAWEYLQQWLENWCVENPATNVVRLTSLFYNFVWIFGDSMRNRSRFVDWASYDFTVSAAALKDFEAEYGYALTAEDFIHQGKLQVTHMPPTKAKRDYMAFIQKFVAEKAKVLVDIIHKHGKLAYVFYDDSWVGMEPYGPHFASIGFDGLIKCVFSGYECRLCANVDVPTHELRFHPYLFPTGLGGLPTFSEGGDPSRDALQYWQHVRRALMRQSVDRIGLGGYLSLTIPFPDFHDTMENMAIEFRRLKELHAHGGPVSAPIRVAVLHTWGSLRSWTLSGHFHETDMHNLIHINEALSGLPVDVRFLSFEDAENGALADVDVVINAGRAGDAWSGGASWQSEKLVAALTRFVHEGGTFIGVGEPSAVEGYQTFFRMAHVLGVDKDTGARVCHGKWRFDVTDAPFAIDTQGLGQDPYLHLTDGKAQVLHAANGVPQMTLNRFGKGWGVYMSQFRWSIESTRMLLEMLLHTQNVSAGTAYLSDRAEVETAYYPADKVLVVASSATEPVDCLVHTPDGDRAFHLEPMETKIIRD